MGVSDQHLTEELATWAADKLVKNLNILHKWNQPGKSYSMIPEDDFVGCDLVVISRCKNNIS